MLNFILSALLFFILPIQKNYNVVHKHTRSLVKRTIGQAKKRIYYQTEAGQHPLCYCSLLHSPQRSKTALRSSYPLHKKRTYSPTKPTGTYRPVLMQQSGDWEKTDAQRLLTPSTDEHSGIIPELIT